ncbi:MAG: UPF0182 family protein [SAR202 cluster bacterium]|nr:UPF0182 family protein [SAR202 cluster bacterium]
MSYNLPGDAGGQAHPQYPGISRLALRRASKIFILIAALFLAPLLVWWAARLYTDWLWFSHLGFLGVFAKILLFKFGLFAGGALAAATVLSLNLYLALRLAGGPSTLALPENTLRLLRALVAGSALAAIIIAALVLGSALMGRWETLLLFFHRVPFGVADPQFGLDITFYVVILRLLQLAQGWLLGLVITAIAGSLALYAAIFSLRGLNLVITPRILKHVAGLGAALMLVIALGHGLHVFGLALASRGAVTGATYTDVHARLPALLFLTAVAVLAAVGFAVSQRFGGLRLMIGCFTLWVIAALLAGVAYPAAFQQLQVSPNQFAREAPYIQRNIEATRRAYQLDSVQEIAFPALVSLTQEAVVQNPATVDNIRLWDGQPLLDVLNQLQFSQLYYTFLNVDSDRYLLDGRLVQVLVAARELEQDSLPADARNWVNQRLQYTHGYGVVMGRATSFTPGDGRPEFLSRDIPIRSAFPVSRPQIFYGEGDARFTLVNTAMPEVDPDASARHYQGSGDLLLNSYLRRLAFSVRFGDVNLLLSDQITPESRIQYRRKVAERVRALAPFLTLDGDPYPALDEAGRVWWLLDGYTTTRSYPYSTVHRGRFNYIRNSVKVTVDAYNGSVQFYTADDADPLLRMYRKAFPGMFGDLEEMPQALRQHLRYPRDLFSAQAQQYLRYHVTDPQVFFNQAEQWAIPLETRFGKPGAQVTPTYLVTTLPGEVAPEFILMVPFSPAGEKRNLVGWLVARNDAPHYGQLMAFRVPGDRQVDGPSQVEARIENDQQVSQQFTLWEGAGSRIVRGQLLVIPIGNAIIYVEPLYLRSEVVAFPELKKVIVADGNRLVMADSVREGLARLTGGVTAPPAPGGGPPQFREDLERIQDAVRQLQQSLDALQKALDDLGISLGGSGPP